jgi:hypothetical protein
MHGVLLLAGIMHGVLLLPYVTLGHTVLFPGQTGRHREARGRESNALITPCPGEEAWCEEAEDYPGPGEYPSLHDIDMAPLVKETLFAVKNISAISASHDSDLKTRFFDYDFPSDLIQESRACDNRQATVYPKKARNMEGNFVFILNDHEYKQAVDIEQCINEGEKCRTEGDAPTFGTTVCRQKYTTYKMYVINQEGEQVFDTFSLPSACLCHHKSDLSISGLNTR